MSWLSTVVICEELKTLRSRMRVPVTTSSSTSDAAASSASWAKAGKEATPTTATGRIKLESARGKKRLSSMFGTPCWKVVFWQRSAKEKGQCSAKRRLPPLVED